jgi:hypothetical protein
MVLVCKGTKNCKIFGWIYMSPGPKVSMHLVLHSWTHYLIANRLYAIIFTFQ